MSEMKDYFERLEDDKCFLRTRLEEHPLYPDMKGIELDVEYGEAFAIFYVYAYDSLSLIYYRAHWNYETSQLEIERIGRP